jgi:hypothetical protein
MAKAKAEPKRAPAGARRTRPSPARGFSPRTRDVAGQLWEGHVLDVDARGLVRARLAGGQTIAALCPAHVDARWVAEAARLAPLPAVFMTARPSGRFVLFGVLPEAAHAEARTDVVIRGREIRLEGEALQVASRSAQLRMDADGNVTMRGRDVTSHARRVNRIRGGAIRLN